MENSEQKAVRIYGYTVDSEDDGDLPVPSFEVSVKKLFLHYSMRAEICPAVAEELVAHVCGIVVPSPAPYQIVIDVQDFEIDPRTFRAFATLGAQLKKIQAQIYVVSPSRGLAKLISDTGMSAVLRPVESLAAIGSEIAENSRSRFDVNLINPFIEGAIHTLGVQCQTKAEPGRLSLREPRAEPLPSDIAGVLLIASPTFSGELSVCFPGATFLALMGRMLGEPLPEITKELEDGSAEIMSMIAAHGRKILNENGMALDRAIPSVARGARECPAGGGGAIVLPFATEIGPFHMEICLRNTA